MRSEKIGWHIVLSVGFLVVTGCGAKESPSQDGQTQDSMADSLTWVEVTEHPVVEELLLSGGIVADERRVGRVVIPVGGKVSGIAVEAGDEVARGQRLAVVSSTEAAEYQREMQAAQSEERLARRELAMKEQLLADGMASEKEVNEARERLRVAEVTLREQQTIGHINGIGHQPEAVLTAPVGGTILSRQVYDNQFVEAGTLGFVIADLSRVWAVADVYETDISRIREGASVEVQTMAWPGETFSGRIEKIHGALSDDSKTMKVRIDLDNPDGKLRPGMFASVKVVVPERQLPRLLPCVPSDAVIFENGHRYVIVLNSQACRRQEVTVAREADGYIYLKNGISAGQQVVAKNALLVFNQLGQ